MSPVAPKNFINHIGLLVDASGSMASHQQAVVKVVDGLIRDLATSSKTTGMETRISIWAFDSTNAGARIVNLVWDTDVLRLPSIAGRYTPDGGTPLIDACIKVIEDLKLITEVHGDHAFLFYVITDGEELHSRSRPLVLQTMIRELPNNWTPAALVPNVHGLAFMKTLGFPAGNIAIWDTASRTGFEELGEKVATANTGYANLRSTGTRSTTTLFAAGTTAQVNPATLANLKPIDRSKYELHQVPIIPEKTEIAKFVSNKGLPDNVVGLGWEYRSGEWFYQLTAHAGLPKGQKKRERLAPGKEIAIREKGTDKLYVGDAARQLLGLPLDATVNVEAAPNNRYNIFIRSDSTNRHLVSGTQLLRKKW